MKIFRTGAHENLYDLPISINWGFTSQCNYRCTYCFDYGTRRGGGVNIQQVPFSSLEQIKIAVKNIASLNRPCYNVTFGGGEPTIHPHLSDAISLLHENLGDRLNNVLIISNGSRNKILYQKIAEFSKYIPFTLLISIHTDHAETEHICELIENLSDKVTLTFSLMFNPAKRERVYSIHKTLIEYRKKFPFSMRVVLLREDDKLDPRYNKDDIEWQQVANKHFKEVAESAHVKFEPSVKPKHTRHLFYDIEHNGKRMIGEENDHNLKLTNGLLRFKGMFCTAHAAVLRIEPGGLCKGMVCGADPCICNIFQENSLLANRDKLIHLIRCPYELCGCSVNDAIPKFASVEEAIRFAEVVREKQNALFDAYTPLKS